MKTLIASGCSFTFETWNWPGFLSNSIGAKLINVGMGSQGNGLISKKMMYALDNELKDKSPDDIIVGIMWSGIDRNEFYVDDISDLNDLKKLKSIDKWTFNPTSVINGEENTNWVITNSHWKNKHSKLWYENYHTNIGSMVNTIQYILLTQWYLERKNVKYFMTTYLDIFHGEHSKNFIAHPEVSYLYDMIDFSKFLPISGCHEWVKEHYGDKDGFNAPDINGYIGIHPTKYGHEMFSNEVIIPFLNEKKIL